MLGNASRKATVANQKLSRAAMLSLVHSGETTPQNRHLAQSASFCRTAVWLRPQLDARALPKTSCFHLKTTSCLPSNESGYRRCHITRAGGLECPLSMEAFSCQAQRAEARSRRNAGTTPAFAPRDDKKPLPMESMSSHSTMHVLCAAHGAFHTPAHSTVDNIVSRFFKA